MRFFGHHLSSLSFLSQKRSHPRLSRGSHYLSRHGPYITDEQLKERATTGVLPDTGVKAKPVPSSRYFNLFYLKQAILLAQRGYRLTGRNTHKIDHGQIVGGGYLLGGTQYVKAQISFVVICKKGVVITAYPKITPCKIDLQSYPSPYW